MKWPQGLVTIFYKLTNLNSQLGKQAGAVTHYYTHTVTLSHYQTVTLSHCHTVTLSLHQNSRLKVSDQDMAVTSFPMP